MNGGGDASFEMLARMRERISSLEQRANDLEDRIHVGDNNVRQGIEVVKDITTTLQAELKVIGTQILGDEGKAALRDTLREIQESLSDLRREFNKHLTEHERSEGASRAFDQLKRNWVQPVATGIVIGVVLLLLQIFVNAKG